MTIRHDNGVYIITECDRARFGEHRFALDRREPAGDVCRLVNVGWYRTYRGALNALSMEQGGLEGSA